ncbi:MAG: hypothetical protein E7330_01270 [Clostridiales bacterium]|nr:hypothetical protein [Clostridiales bacterium]
MMQGFLEYLKEQVGRSVYVWGGQGETEITEKWVRSRENKEANILRVMRFYEGLRSKGISPIRAYDCSGLILHYWQDRVGFFTSDMTAAGLFRLCTALEKTALQPGDLVFRHNGTAIHHVGVYMGDGQVIEAEGRDRGVVERHIDAGGTGYWNRFGRPPFFDLKKTDDSCFARVKGDSVNLRAGPGTEYPIVTVTHRGDPLLARAEREGWCETAAIAGGKMQRGYMSAKYIERNK